MSGIRSYRAAYSEEDARHLSSGPDGKHGGTFAMMKAIQEGADSFTYNGRTYVRGLRPPTGSPVLRFLKELFCGD